jgi:hypothetical protein
VSALSVHDAERMFESLQARRVRFPDEDEHTAFMVVVLNFGDHLTRVTCVGPEGWSGTKGDLTPRDGIPLCPNGHPMLEHVPRLRLGLVEEEVPR